jgi:threonine aldolase
LFPIDLRSDTVTKPSAKMRQVMCEAEVGDDVYGEDPTVVRLEQKAAQLVGKEAGLYVTSGTQGNLVSLLTHCGRGDGAIVGRDSHILNFEGGGLCALGGIVAMQADDQEGLPEMADLNHLLRPKNNVHFAQPKLLCLENTHNRCGGHASTPQEVAQRVSWAHQRGLAVHMDGARLFNAAVALGVKLDELVKDIDSVQLCLSKGLGAPIGSVICASRDFVERARFWRKKVGGGLRQVGITAAAGLYALEHNVSRLAEDHENALLMAETLRKGGLSVSFSAPAERTEEGGPVRRSTNMVYVSMPDEARADKLLAACGKRQVLFSKSDPRTYRMVTHLDVSREQALRAAQVIVEEYRA